MNSITIVDYLPKYQGYFENLNKHWIEKYFEMESTDQFILTHPEEAILKPGGAILMALFDEIVAGTVALKKLDEITFEFAKMAVDEHFQKKGIAEALSNASFKKAKQLGGKKIVLYTNNILKPAINLYEKIGFKHVSGNNHKQYARANIKMMIELS